MCPGSVADSFPPLSRWPVSFLPHWLRSISRDTGEMCRSWTSGGTQYRSASRRAARNLSVDDLFRQQNAHYFVFHNLTTILLTWSTRWNLKVGMYLTLALAAAVYALALGLYGWRRSVLWLPFSIVVFSLRQRETWLWALLDTYEFLSLMMLAALFVLARHPGTTRALTAAAVMCIIATFTAASGMVSWPVLLLVLPALGYRDRTRRVVWIVIALLTAIVFFTNYRWLRSGLVTEPRLLASFVLTYLGSPLTPPGANAVASARLAAVGGVLLIASNAAYLLRKQADVYRPHVITTLTLAGYAGGCALLTGAGRAFLGTTGALQTRYVTQASLFWLGVIGLAVVAVVEGRSTTPRFKGQPVVGSHELLSARCHPPGSGERQLLDGS